MKIELEKYTKLELIELLKTKHKNSVLNAFKKSKLIEEEFKTKYPSYKSKDMMEYIYCFLHNIEYPKKCQCGNKCAFRNLTEGYPFDVCGKPHCPFTEVQKLEKRKQTCLKKYGVENISQLSETREKVKKTNLEKFGTTCNLKLDSVKEAIKQTNLKKYGVMYTLQNKSVQEKAKQTNLKKYGVVHAAQNKSVQEKTKQTNLERYGSTCTLHNPDIQKKARLSFALQHVEKVLEHFKSLKNPITQPLFTAEDYIKQGGSKYNTLYKWKCTKCGYIFLHNYTHGRLPLCPKCFPKSISSGHRSVLEFIQDTCSITEGIVINTRNIISPYELDIYLTKFNLAIEFNGTYWHNSLVKDKDYHQIKYQKCLEKGIKLINIWEYDWLDPIKQNIIKNRIKNLLGIYDDIIYARKCVVKPITSMETEIFLNAYHLQGSINSKVNLGLYYNDQLISVMTFGKPRFNKNYEWELLRFVNKFGLHVPGGASKLLKYFEKEYKPKNLISYDDLSWGKGTLYSKLGFNEIGISKPNYIYIERNEGIIYTRYQCQKHKLKDLLGEDNFDPNKSETDNMEINGFLKVYDCGNLVFVKEYEYAK